MRFLILVSLLFTQFVFAAEDCKDVTISTEHMPKNNRQGVNNWCVFWTSTDLFSFYEKTPLSSYDMALQYFNREAVRAESPYNDHTDVGGNTQAALLFSQQGKGLCHESQTNFTDNNWLELSILFAKISSDEKTLNAIICENQLQSKKPFNEIPKNILNILNKLSGDKKAAALLDVTCGKRSPVGRYGVGTRSIDNFTDAKVIEKIDQLLDSNNPSSISYDKDSVFQGADYTRLSMNHSSTVTGRRFNPKTNKCEYKIKDTFGNFCPVSSIYDCERATGSMWIPRENLQKNIYEVNWVVPPKPKD